MLDRRHDLCKKLIDTISISMIILPGSIDEWLCEAILLMLGLNHLKKMTL